MLVSDHLGNSIIKLFGLVFQACVSEKKNHYKVKISNQFRFLTGLGDFVLLVHPYLKTINKVTGFFGKILKSVKLEVTGISDEQTLNCLKYR